MEVRDESPDLKELTDALEALEAGRIRRDPSKLLNPRVDYVFKHIFGSDDSKSGSEALRSLLSAVMEMPPERVEGLKIRNSEFPGDSRGGKCIRLDLLVQLTDGMKINVEMQVEGLALDRQMKRVLFYLCRLFTAGRQAGLDYDDLRPTVSIVFTERIHHPDDAEAVHVYRMRGMGEELTDALEVRIVEMKKANLEKGLTTDDPLAGWLCFLEFGEGKEVARMLAEKGPGFAQAFSRLDELSFEDDEWVVAFEREKALLWEAMNRHYYEHHMEEELAKAAARAEKAVAEATAEGRSEERVETIRRLLALGLETAVVAEGTGSTSEEVERIRNEVR